MVKLYCNCLNICINTQGTELEPLDGQTFLCSTPNDLFFNGNVYEVKLAVAGIKKELEILIREHVIEDWTVYKCLGCDTEPFALHSVKKEDRVLVNGNILSDPKIVGELTKSKNTSPAFKIILEPAPEEEESSVNGFSSDTITAAGARVQEHVRRYLKNEEDAMLERIRKYTEEQKRLYTAVQARAYSDKRAMLSILRRAAESKVQESLSDAMADLEIDSSIPDERPLHSEDFPDGSAEMRIVQTPSTGSSWIAKDKPGDVDSDHLDPLFQNHDDFQPFVESDEGESSDNSFNSKTDIEDMRSNTRYSSSVPVNVPFMNRAKSSYRKRSVHDDDCEEIPSPDKIAESIQALARSVHDSREIFGELPRPRKNTLPVKFS